MEPVETGRARKGVGASAALLGGGGLELSNNEEGYGSCVWVVGSAFEKKLEKR